MENIPDNSRGAVLSGGVLFDPFKRAGTTELVSAVRTLADSLQEQEQRLGIRKRRRTVPNRTKFHLAVEALVCNLLVLKMLDSERPLAVPKSSAVMWSKGRYAVPVYGQHFLDALKIMAHPEVDVIENVARGYKFASGPGQRSTIRARPKIFQSVSVSPSDWSDFKRDDQGEVLVLKAAKPPKGTAEAIDYRDNKKTKALRNEILLLNKHLSEAPIIISNDLATIGLDRRDQPIDPTRRSLRRIFSNGKWTEGGRLFDGFWETMRREDRFRLLRIGTDLCPDGEPIANVDYGQLFPRLAYLMEQCPAPEGDLYDIFDDGSCRAGFKMLFNALLFARGRLTRWPEDNRALFPARVTLPDAIAAIEAKHEPIAHHFGSGLGHRLMFTESTILLDVLADLRRMAIVALPLHDSVLVAWSKAETARAVLEDAFRTHLLQDFRATVTIDYRTEFA